MRRKVPKKLYFKLWLVILMFILGNGLYLNWWRVIINHEGPVAVAIVVFLLHMYVVIIGMKYIYHYIERIKEYKKPKVRYLYVQRPMDDVKRRQL